MKTTDRNIIMITSGGVGARFGASVPKQYIEIDGRQVISYVIEACRECRQADAIVVMADSRYHDELSRRYGVDVADSGPACEKVLVVDAVRPTVTGALLDKFFTLLDEYDAVACARKITDSLGRYGEWVVNREEYYTMNAPEGFRFSLLDRHFRADSPLTESIQQLPPTSKVYLDFDAPYFEKLTYPEDFARLRMLLDGRKTGR